MAVSPAQAVIYRVSQESSAGAGDFDANILGTINAYNTAGTIAQFYKYSIGFAASFNGSVGLTPNKSHLFLVNASDGLNLWWLCTTSRRTAVVAAPACSSI